MSNGALTSIVWRQQRATEIEVSYESGDTETVTGTHADATRMAREAGMRLVGSPLGTTRWAREDEQPGGRSPKRIGPWLSS